MAFLEAHLAAPPARLADFTCRLIEAAAQHLDLRVEFVRAGDLGAPGDRSEHLLAICEAVDADAYVSPQGSADYMAEDGVFAGADFPVRYQGFVELPYPQGHEPFTPYMAFVDAVMNLGWRGTRGLIDRMG